MFDGLQATLRDEVLRVVVNVHKQDALALEDEEHDTELTRLAERAVEQGVNEIGSGEVSRDDDFTITKVKSQSEANKTRNVARKKKKAQRQNRKKGRR